MIGKNVAKEGYKKMKGVTLPTLILIISLILVLVLIGTVVFRAQDERATRSGVAHSCMNPMVKALEMYRVERGDYPPATASIDSLAPQLSNIAALRRKFRNPAYGGNRPQGGLQIIRPTENSACIWGEIDGIDGEYEIIHCVGEIPSTAPYNLEMPICCWDNTADETNNCGNPPTPAAARWYSCTEKM